MPRFTHPGAGQVFYFVLTDRFANGSTANDDGGIAGGPEVSGFDPSRIGYYHGGDLAGLTARLDYIKGLGATTVWVTPPFVNKPMQLGSAGYHGYWILDFLHVDPHLGTDAEFKEFVAQAHARGLKVCLDIVINHTADVIKYEGGRTDYIPRNQAPYRDAQGRAFDLGAVAYNGLGSPAAFPVLSAARSFAYVPVVPPDEARAKNPAWLNDPVYYHNRGNSLFKDESALDGDFVGLDDVMTENPAVVRGFIDLYQHWIDDFGVDGSRIDTVRHVNREFWQAFAPALREHARLAGKPGFIQFGEVANGTGDVGLLSEFSTTAPLDATLDFGFMGAALAYVSEGKNAEVLTGLLRRTTCTPTTTAMSRRPRPFSATTTPVVSLIFSSATIPRPRRPSSPGWWSSATPCSFWCAASPSSIMVTSRAWSVAAAMTCRRARTCSPPGRPISKMPPALAPRAPGPMTSSIRSIRSTG